LVLTLATLLGASTAAAQASVDVVDVVVAGSSDDYVRLQRAFRRAPGGDTLALRRTSSEALLDALLADAEGVDGRLAAIYLDLEGPAVRFFCLFGSPARLYLREVPRGASLDVATEEILVQLFESTLDALRSGAELGWSHEEARAELSARGITRRHTSFEASVGWAVVLHARSPELRHGPQLVVGASGGHGRWVWLAQGGLDGGRLHRRDGDLRLELLTLGLRVRVGALRRFDVVRVGATLDVGALLVRSDARSDASGVTTAPAALDVEAVASVRGIFDWLPLAWLGVRLELGVELTPNPTVPVFDDRGARQPLLPELWTRPSAALSILWRIP